MLVGSPNSLFIYIYEDAGLVVQFIRCAHYIVSHAVQKENKGIKKNKKEKKEETHVQEKSSQSQSQNQRRRANSPPSSHPDTKQKIKKKKKKRTSHKKTKKAPNSVILDAGSSHFWGTPK